MKKTLPFLLAAALFAGNTWAALPEGSGHDVKDYPDNYYSTNAEALDSVAILPPPPAFDSILFSNDQAQYQQGKLMRTGERGEMAIKDANDFKFHESLSDAFGIRIDKEATPEIYKLVNHLSGELGDLPTRSAKKKYNRVRPFVFYHEATCYPNDEESLAKDGSYPSAHTSHGWGTALILSEINPDRKEAILKRGYEIGQSRVICGYHWQSDVDAGRIAGTAAYALLHTNPDFLKQLKKAKAEFARLRKEGKVAGKAESSAKPQ